MESPDAGVEATPDFDVARVVAILEELERVLGRARHPWAWGVYELRRDLSHQDPDAQVRAIRREWNNLFGTAGSLSEACYGVAAPAVQELWQLLKPLMPKDAS